MGVVGFLVNQQSPYDLKLAFRGEVFLKEGNDHGFLGLQVVFLGNAKGDHLAIAVLLGAGDDAGGPDVFLQHGHHFKHAIEQSGVFFVFFL